MSIAIVRAVPAALLLVCAIPRLSAQNYIPVSADLERLADAIAFPSALQESDSAVVAEAFLLVGREGRVERLNVYSDRQEIVNHLAGELTRIRFQPARWEGMVVPGYAHFTITLNAASEEPEERVVVRVGDTKIHPMVISRVADGNPDPDDFVPVEVAPLIDIADLQRRAILPDMAVRYHLEGRVIFRVLIDTGSNLAGVLIVDRISHIPLEIEAARVVEATRFEAARSGGKPVATWIQVPVTFKLP